jgi:hypothetical protein
MEVLISTFVLSIGMLGLAALIPVGRYAIVESGKADRSAACGRAAMRDIKVRRMLDYRQWDHPSAPGETDTSPVPFVIDPIGRARGKGNQLGPLNRFNLKHIPDLNTALLHFGWNDDLTFTEPKSADERPKGYFDHYSGGSVTTDNNPTPAAGVYTEPASSGHYTWLATVAPANTENDAQYWLKKTFHVSVAVCFQRDFTDEGEESTTATFEGGGAVQYGGGAVTLTAPVQVRANQWVLMYHPGGGNVAPQCHWYRVVSAGNTVDGNPGVDMLMLAGPDWQGTTGTCIVIKSVIGVYATTIEQASGIYDPLWLRF